MAAMKASELAYSLPCLLLISRIRPSGIFDSQLTSEIMNPFKHFGKTHWMGDPRIEINDLHD
jgi:hypothetical protein